MERYRHLKVVVGDGAPEKTAELAALLEREPMLNSRIVAAVWVAGRRWNLRLDNGIDIRLPEEDPGAALQRLGQLERDHRLLARDIAASAIPVVSAVGHEVDVTLADFVADLRAPTPSAAAELVGPDLGIWQRRLDQAHQRLLNQARQALARQQERFHHLRQRLPHPRRLLQQAAQQVDELDGRLQRQVRLQLAAEEQRLNHLQRRLTQAAPQAKLTLLSQRLHSLERRLPAPVKQQLKDSKSRVAQLGQRLNLASPLQTLARGYSITLHDEQAVTRVSDIQPGDTLRTRVTDGELISTVSAIRPVAVSGKDND